MKFEKETLGILEKAVNLMEGGFEDLPDIGTSYDVDRIEEIMLEVARKMRDNYPYFHPFYAGQMLKPPHPVARLAYMLSLWINPNNHALDGGRASSFMEKEAVAEIARLIGWKSFLGHLTSGGTVANMEALWIAGKLKPAMKVLASEQAHYTHARISEVLGLSFRSVPCDAISRMDIDALKKALDEGGVGTVVATIGTTGAGAVDPLPEILSLRDDYQFRLHADAAYGGYFTLVDNLQPDTRQSFDLLGSADSMVIDPHKHGLQPYGCGCILFRDPAVGVHYKHDSPYTYFTSSDLHLGEISLECSRAGASAVALWATQKLLPMVPNGEFARGLGESRKAALTLYEKLRADGRFRVIFPPELDIVIWAPNGKKASEISRLSEKLFAAAAEENLHFAAFRYPSPLLQQLWDDVEFDRPHVTCLRSCLMKPEHNDCIEAMWKRLVHAADSIHG